MNSEQNTVKGRSGNFELMRIVAMCMIIAHHVIVHCVRIQLSDMASISKMDNGWFNEPRFFTQLLIPATIMPMGQIGNILFILVSGFFLVKKGKNIDFIRIPRKLLGQLAFACLTLMLLSTLLYRLTACVPGRFIGMIGISYFSGGVWFAGYYFVIVLVGWLFLNEYLRNLSKSGYKCFLLILLAFSQFSYLGALIQDLAQNTRTIVFGFFVYALGGYIAKYNPFATIRAWALWAVILLDLGVLYVSTYNTTAINLEYFQPGNGNFTQSLTIYETYNMIALIPGIIIFELFRRIQITGNRAIAFLGQATFMVYLIHDNDLFYSLWNTTDWITALYVSPISFLLKLLGWLFLTFLSGTLIYGIYVMLIKLMCSCSKYVVQE